MAEKKYRVRHINNVDPDDCILEFDTPEAAESAIKESLGDFIDRCTELFPFCFYRYTINGNKSECWISGEVPYASWERLWVA